MLHPEKCVRNYPGRKTVSQNSFPKPCFKGEKIPFVLCLMMIDIHIIQGSCDSVLDDERLNSEGLGLQEVDLPANLTASAMQVSIAQT